MACACGKDSCGCAAPQEIWLQDEQGQLHAFYVSDRLTLGDRTYVLAVSLEAEEQYALLKVVPGPDGQERLTNIPDEAEWNELQQALLQMSR
ncbi:DUF1292 domain-containing protein [Alicyclobacillus sp.]|uniref:DUF1292 domain-containing protein n=1 Tax=Alicyclobacillus sp. TaxID=61169 RepID=UPI0025BD6D9A|nr:DUF1292 domain-containing protein [Alicyclobacillus sp.]MCL6517248.1 DUF1292 domain-containing protein [Alicyclobacillus sp.]